MLAFDWPNEACAGKIPSVDAWETPLGLRSKIAHRDAARADIFRGESAAAQIDGHGRQGSARRSSALLIRLLSGTG
jgi:hypothetical protein